MIMMNGQRKNSIWMTVAKNDMSGKYRMNGERKMNDKIEPTLAELVKKHGPDFKKVVEKAEWFDESAKPKKKEETKWMRV